MAKSIEHSTIDALARHKGLDPATISLESRLTDLGVSSLDAITIIYEMEEEFDVEIPNEALEGLATVGDTVERIGALVEAGG